MGTTTAVEQVVMPPLIVGAVIPCGLYRGWKIAAVGWIGERYYWLQSPERPRGIAMLPADYFRNLCHPPAQ